MSDQEQETEVGGHAEPLDKSKVKGVLVIGAALLLIIGGAVTVYLTGLPNLWVEPMDTATAKDSSTSAGPVFYDLPDMIVNLGNIERGSKVIKLRITLELGSSRDVAVVDSRMPRIVDDVEVFLRELRLEDIKGPKGISRLDSELMARAAAASLPARVNDVLFREFFVQ